MTVIRVVVQERRRLFRDGLAMLLDGEPDFEVAAKVRTAAEVVQACAAHGPDLIVLEADVTDWDPARLVATLRKRRRALRVVGIYNTLDRVQAGRLRQAGVRGLVAREAGYGAVLSTVRGRQTSTGPVVMPSVQSDLAVRRLTERQLEVLALVSGGATTKDISVALGISPKTVENHKQRVFARLDVQNQAHAVAVAMREGLLSPVAGRVRTARHP